jgi:glycosyltransferase involved in cell wall biosynthesis
MKYVSIITVNFNDSKGLEETILSVRSQSGVQCEHIIVDGGSDDGSLEVIRKHEAAIARWVSEADRGPYDGMNKGLDLATGEWVLFLNAGDVFSQPDILSGLAGLMQKEDIVAVYGDSIADYGDFRVYRKALEFSEIWKGMILSHQALLIRSSRIGEKRFDLNYPKIADYDLLLRCLAGSEGVAYKPTPFVVCDAHGISNRGQAAIARGYYRVARRYFRMDMGKKAYFAGKLILLAGIDLVKGVLPAHVYFSLVKRSFKGKEA